MHGNDNDPRGGAAASACVTIGCLTAFVIDQAREQGCVEHAHALEKCLAAFLKTLPKGQRRRILQTSYALEIQTHLPDPVRLRLVHSRD